MVSVFTSKYSHVKCNSAKITNDGCLVTSEYTKQKCLDEKWFSYYSPVNYLWTQEWERYKIQTIQVKKTT